MALLYDAFLFLIFYSSFFAGVNPTQTCLFEDKTHLYATSIGNVSQNPSITHDLHFNDDTIEIEFDIMLHQYCNSHAQCTIFYLSNTHQSISLSLDNNTALILSLSHNGTITATQSINPVPFLSADGKYHHIYLLLHLDPDGSSSSIAIIDDLYWYLPPFHFISVTNTSFTLYLNGPSQVPIDATLSNLCVESAARSVINTDHMNISCGYTISNVILPEQLVYPYTLALNDSYSVTMDDCVSTEEIILNVYDSDDVALSALSCDTNHNSTLFMKRGMYSMDISTVQQSEMSDADRYILSVHCAVWEEESVQGGTHRLSNALFLLLLLSLIMLISCYYCNNRYMNAFVVNKAMVLIIGIARFDDPKWYLRGVFLNVQELANLWKVKYGYDVWICKKQTKRNTKLDIEEFIEEQTEILRDGEYQCVIVHILSHGTSEGDVFMTSDGCMMKVADIRRELSSAVSDPSELVKIIFNHECRESGFNDLDDRIDDEELDYKGFTTFDDSNWATIWANIKGHSVSELAHFTTWVTESLGQNLTSDREKKTGFTDLMTAIGINLEHETGGKYSSDMDHTLHYSQLILERCRNPNFDKRTMTIDGQRHATQLQNMNMNLNMNMNGNGVEEEIEPIATTEKQFVIKISEMP